MKHFSFIVQPASHTVTFFLYHIKRIKKLNLFSLSYWLLRFVVFFRSVFSQSTNITQPWKSNSSAISGSVVVWIAVSAGTSPSTAWNVEGLSLSMVCTISLTTTVERIRTSTKPDTLQGTAREFPRAESEWDFTQEIAWVKRQGRHLPVIILWPVSWSRKRHLLSRN